MRGEREETVSERERELGEDGDINSSNLFRLFIFIRLNFIRRITIYRSI